METPIGDESKTRPGDFIEKNSTVEFAMDSSIDEGQREATKTMFYLA